MKKIIQISILGLLITGIISSCSLDEINKSAVTSDNYITSESEYEELVTAAYMYLRPLLGSTNTHMMWYGTDIYSRTGEVNSSSQVGIDDYSYLDPNDGSCYNFWSANYDVITKTNTAMSRGEDIELSDETRSVRTAEMLALRSYAYFNLVETFGGVPLILEESLSPTFTYTRASEEEVYTQIVSDLETAIESLPASLTSSDFGRVDLGMAKHLLGKILLTRSYKSFAVSDDLSRAITYFNDVIALHPMVSDWSTLFGDNGYDNTNSEVIFSVRYSTNQNYNGLTGNGLYQHFKFALYMWPGNTHRGAPYWRSDVSYMASEDYLNSFEDNDIRSDETYLVRHVVAGASGSAGDVTFEKGDTVIYFPKDKMNNEEITEYQAANPSVYLVCNPDRYHELFVIGNQNVCYPMVYKFYDPNVPEYTGSVTEGEDGMGTRDTYIFRTAETKLLLAEAYLKNGQADEALQQVNDIRTRANATPLTSIDLEKILDESGRELFGEANRWMDLKRCGKLFERAYKYNKFVQAHHSNASDIDSHFLLRPIPQTEIERTQYSLTQNPGYSN